MRVRRAMARRDFMSPFSARGARYTARTRKSCALLPRVRATRMRNARTVSVSIFRDARETYEYIRATSHLTEWATGLGAVTGEVDDVVQIDTPNGPGTLKFAPPNDFGILDHTIALESGAVTEVPMRVLSNGDGCEVMLTIFQPEDMTEREFSRDANWVKRDLETLRDALEV